MGHIASAESLRSRYCVDAVHFTDELGAEIKSALGRCAKSAKVHVMKGVNSDSGTDLSAVLGVESNLPKDVPRDDATVYEVLAECRVIKSTSELELMRYVSWVSSNAHVATMRQAAPGQKEYQMEATFLYHCYFSGGCRVAAYTSICACGPNSAVLHYGHAGAPNDAAVRKGDMLLLDMGAEYHCYCSDITCSFPADGVFTPEQKLVFEAVATAQRAVISAMGVGVSWSDMHVLMNRTILEELKRGGVLVGDVDAMLVADLGATFTPHGLGHLIGIDTHDVGGYLSHTPPRSGRPGLKSLRTARVLAEGMVLTVEPGLYFIEALIEPALASDKTSGFFVPGAIDRFRGTGGVRLEDVVVVCADGVDNYTLCPRTVDEVEHVMSGGAWPPARDDAPWLRRRWGTCKDGKMVDRALGNAA